MQQFSQKYAIIQAFEPVPVGMEFSANGWPLHVTIADTFGIEWSAETMIRRLAELLKNHPQAASVVGDDRLFGDDGSIRVALLEKTDSLVALHNDVVELLEHGGWKPNDPQYARAGFLPHSTVQPHARLRKGDRVLFNTLSVIDMFPGGDPYRRRLLAALPIGDKAVY